MRYLIMGLALLIGACSAQSIIEKITTPQERALGMKAATAIQKRNLDGIKVMIDPSIHQELGKVWSQMIDVIPEGTTKPKLIDANFKKSLNGPRVTTLLYEIGDRAPFGLVQLAIVTGAGQQPKLDGVQTFSVEQSPSQAASFSLSGKPLTSYMILAAAIIAVLTCIYAFIAVIRTPGVRLKWLWAIGCLFGFGRIFVDWSTGQVGFQPVNIMFLGAAALKPGALANWVVSAAIPLVAIAFLILRKRLAHDPATEIHAEFAEDPG